MVLQYFYYRFRLGKFREFGRLFRFMAADIFIRVSLTLTLVFRKTIYYIRPTFRIMDRCFGVRGELAYINAGWIDKVT